MSATPASFPSSVPSPSSRGAQHEPLSGRRDIVRPGSRIRTCSNARGELAAVSWANDASRDLDASIQAVMFGRVAALVLYLTVRDPSGGAPIVRLSIDGERIATLDMRYLTDVELGGLWRADHPLPLTFADGAVHRLEIALLAAAEPITVRNLRAPPEETSRQPAPTASQTLLFYAQRFSRPAYLVSCRLRAIP